MKGEPFLIKGIQKDYLFCQSGKQKGKGLDIQVEPPL